MKTYELTYIITPEISAEEAESLTKEIETFLQQRQGVVSRSENPLPKVLSYRIKNQGSGFLGILEFQLPEEAVKDIKEMLEKDNRILRHMICIKKQVKEKKGRKERKRPVSSQVETIEKKYYIKKEQPSEVLTKEDKEKVELEDIGKKLDEILNE